MARARKMDGNGEQARAETLTEQAYLRLEEMIVTLKLAPGAILSEQALSLELGIGRTPIREALQRLAREGLVLVLPRKAILVTETDPRKQLLVLEVRREIERLLARVSAERASVAERAPVSGDRGRDGSGRRIQRRHRLPASGSRAEHAAGGGRAQRVRRPHHAFPQRPFAPFLVSALQAGGRSAEVARLHADEARAIARGKPDRAMAASDKLIDYVENFIRATVGAEARPERAAGRARGAGA